MIASKQEWGQAAWTFMHVLACKIKQKEFQAQKEAIINIIRGICSNVPCPSCRSHAEVQMKQLNPGSIRSKNDLIDMLMDFHNKVNIRTQKRLFTKGEMKIYETMSTGVVVQKFLAIWYSGSSTPRLMMDTFARVNFLHSIQKYFDDHHMAYDP